MKTRTDELKESHEKLLHEIEERKRAEEALRKSEELYRALAKNLPNGAVILFDLDLRYILAEGAGLTEVGLSKELLEGKTIWELFSPEICLMLEPNYRAALTGKRNSFEIPYANRMYLVHTLPVRNQQRVIWAGMVMVQDITERKQAEERIVRLSRLYSVLSKINEAIVRIHEPERLYEHSAVQIR